MVKTAAMVFIAAGFALGGCCASSYQSKKAKITEDIILMVSVDAGEAFPVAWKKSIESETAFCRLLSDLRGYLLRFGADLGSTDIEGQLSCCEYYKQIFEKELVQREENAKKYSKLYPALGMMLGISAAILIV